MKKKKLILIIYIPVFIIGIIYVVIMNKIENKKLINAPKISFEIGLQDIYVNSISFERNGLYLNKILYNSAGISSYSRVHNQNAIIELEDIKPPFIIRKKVNNDTLEIIKKNQKLYLLVTKEIEYSSYDDISN